MAAESLIHITLPDGKMHHCPVGTTGLALLQALGGRISRETLVMEVNGTVWDLSRSLPDQAVLRWLTWEDPAGKQVFWHSTAHLLAEALEALYPHVKLGIGPPIAQGFYYDADFGNQAFESTHLQAVEQKMQELLREQHPFIRKPMSRREATAHYTTHSNPYKLELIRELNEGTITFYRQGGFIDLCRGPHISHTGHIKAFKLLSVGGAYWKGDVKRKQLTRIYGISFPKKSMLQNYLKAREVASQRDHRKVGKALGFFTFSPKVGAGLPIWLPKGTLVRDLLQRFLQKIQEEQGYQSVCTPHIGSQELYMTSGHYDKYRDGTFKPIDTPHEGERYLLKPMNCPHHCVIYDATPRSYKELPLRLAEFGTVYRYEQSGELHGLTRVRAFTQDDAHIFCTPTQIEEEVKKVVALVELVLKRLTFTNYRVQLSLRSSKDASKYIGEEDEWQEAENALRQVIIDCGLSVDVVAGEAAFYGPKLDFMVHDALGREWQMGTVQVDYQLPRRFQLTYMGADNSAHTPVLIHRAPFGSLERFIALLLEHTGGRLPLWLAPEQVMVLPVSTLHLSYAQEVQYCLKKAGIRASLDSRDEKIGRRIRDAALAKLPYMLVVGAKEAATQTVAVRQHGVGEEGSMPLHQFVEATQQRLMAEEQL